MFDVLKVTATALDENDDAQTMHRLIRYDVPPVLTFGSSTLHVHCIPCSAKPDEANAMPKPTGPKNSPHAAEKIKSSRQDTNAKLRFS
jgi:hypothetical protein